MVELLQRGDSDEGASGTLERTETREEQRTVLRTSLPTLGRALFGGILAFMAIDNLRNLEERVGYAEAKGAPAPERTVPASSVGLLLGGLGVMLWRLPRTSAAAIVGFFAGVTPVMHDFWNEEDEQQQQQEVFHFLKNFALLGAALALLRAAGRDGDD